MKRFWIGFAALMLVAAPAVSQTTIIPHDPWLNWDMINLTGGNADDVEIIVESGTYNPSVLAGEVLMGMPFQNFGVTHADYDGDGDTDTKLSWSNPMGGPILPNGLSHFGLYLKDSFGVSSGRILDAYWTLGGNKVGQSIAISYELTDIWLTGSAEVHMRLWMPQGYFDDREPGAEAGWENIRTFVNIPAGLLSLEDINASLDLADLAQYEVTPLVWDPLTSSYVDITGPLMVGDPDSFFDVYLAHVESEFVGPQYESLLVADVLNQGQVVGTFWNLNPQCPEPGTIALMVLGGAGLLALRRRRR